MNTLLCLVMGLAPVPKHLMGPPVAPPPRPLYSYLDEQGKLRYYARERIENGVKKRVVREGDPEFERRFEVTPVPPNGGVPET